MQTLSEKGLDAFGGTGPEEGFAPRCCGPDLVPTRRSPHVPKRIALRVN